MTFKNILVYYLLSLPIVSYAQNHFTIEGKVSGLTSPKVYLTYTDDYGKYSLDSAVVANEGAFSFSATISHPVKATVFSRLDQWRSDFILEKGKIKLQGDIHINVEVTAGANQKEFFKLQEEERKSAAYFNDLNQKFATAQQQKDTIQIQLIQQQWNDKLKENRDVSIEFIQKHTNLYIALEPLHSLISKNAVDYSEGHSLFEKISSELKSSAMGEKITELLAKNKLTAIGEHYTDFEQPDQSGRRIKLSSVLGQRYTLVHFWMSGSPSGRKENIAILPIYEKYKSKGLAIVAVSFDEDRDDWFQAIEADKASWIQLSDLKGWNRNSVADLYNISTLPQNFLLDSKGDIVAKNLFGHDLLNYLQEVLR